MLDHALRADRPDVLAVVDITELRRNSGRRGVASKKPDSARSAPNPSKASVSTAPRISVP